MSERGDEGFTFVETLMALAIILIMSAGVGFTGMKAIGRARVVACKTQISSFRIALETYYLDCGAYPTEAQGIRALWEKPVISPVPESWAGPYVDREPAGDPWGNEYSYESPGEHGLPFAIMSYGADGEREGDGDNEDILSWK
jgi:general secretion pathway protein G